MPESFKNNAKVISEWFKKWSNMIRKRSQIDLWLVLDWCLIDSWSILSSLEIDQKWSILDLGFWVWGLGFWISYFGFWILDSGFCILYFGFCILDFVFLDFVFLDFVFLDFVFWLAWLAWLAGFKFAWGTPGAGAGGTLEGGLWSLELRRCIRTL